MKRVKITVTREDIRRGKSCRSRECPIALASRRALPTVDIVVNCRTLDMANCVRITESAHRFLQDFDLGKPVKPFSFTVLVPEELVRRKK